MIHRFVDLFAEAVSLDPNIVVLAFEGSPLLRYDLWKAGNLATPERFDTTVISSTHGTADFLADPELSPDGTEVIYCRAGHNLSPAKNSIRKVDWDDTTNVELYLETSNSASLHPTWAPDGSRIMFRAKGATTFNLIKAMDPDGTNVTTLYTGGALVLNPYYNSDGTKIAWSENNTVKVADSDGTNVATVRAPVSPAFVDPPVWANTQDVLAFFEGDSTASSTSRYWRSINADGTGLATLVTIASGQSNPNSIKWSWLPDDSAIITTRHVTADPSPNHILTKVMADGSGYVDISPEQRLSTATPDTRPVAIGTRVYFPDANPTFTQLSSVKDDGSDYRTDLDGPTFTPNVVFHGFKGDTVNV